MYGQLKNKIIISPKLEYFKKCVGYMSNLILECKGRQYYYVFFKMKKIVIFISEYKKNIFTSIKETI